MAVSDDAALVAVVADVGDEGTRDLFRRLLQGALQELIEAELTAAIGAGRHERSPARSNWRNGGRWRLLATPVGDVELRIPKVWEGSFFPGLLEPRRRVDQALWAVIMEAYVHGTSTRKVDDLVRALGSSRACPSPPCRGSARTWTPRSRASAVGLWITPASRTCSATPRTSRPASTVGWCLVRW